MPPVAAVEQQVSCGRKDQYPVDLVLIESVKRSLQREQTQPTDGFGLMQVFPEPELVAIGVGVQLEVLGIRRRQKPEAVVFRNVVLQELAHCLCDIF